MTNSSKRTIITTLVLALVLAAASFAGYLNGPPTITWGSITGTLSSQSDLVSQFSGKQSAALTGTTSAIGGGLLTAGVCATGTIAVVGSLTSQVVYVSPNTYPGDGSVFYGYVSTNGTVTVKVCGLLSVTPSSSTYNVKVL